MIQRPDAGKTNDDDEELDDIWDEINAEGVNPNIIIDEKQRVKATSLNRLVERLTGDKLDAELLSICLCTLHTFTTPDIFLTKLFQRYNVPFSDELSEDAFVKTVQKPIQTRMVSVLNEWMMTQYHGVYDQCHDYNQMSHLHWCRVLIHSWMKL